VLCVFLCLLILYTPDFLLGLQPVHELEEEAGEKEEEENPEEEEEGGENVLFSP